MYKLAQISAKMIRLHTLVVLVGKLSNQRWRVTRWLLRAKIQCSTCSTVVRSIGGWRCDHVSYVLRPNVGDRLCCKLPPRENQPRILSKGRPVQLTTVWNVITPLASFSFSASYLLLQTSTTMTAPSSVDSDAVMSGSDQDFPPSHCHHDHSDDYRDPTQDGGNDHCSSPPSGLISRSFYHLKRHWQILFMGQVLSLFLALGGAAQATLHLDCQLSAPTFTMAAIYLILAVVHLTLLSLRQRKESQQRRELTHDTHQVFLVDQPNYNLCFFGTVTMWEMVLGWKFYDFYRNAIHR